MRVVGNGIPKVGKLWSSSAHRGRTGMRFDTSQHLCYTRPTIQDCRSWCPAARTHGAQGGKPVQVRRCPAAVREVDSTHWSEGIF
jgi:hypothetical protein